MMNALRAALHSGRLRRYWPLALMLLGALLLVHVGTQYATMYVEQKRLAAEFEMQASRPADAGTIATRVADPELNLTKLLIPKIDLDSMVVDGTSRRALLVGPGHITSTARPGETGNSVITAHRDTFFRRIVELERGDRIQVRRGGKLYTYEVTGKRVVQPTDTSVLRPTSDPQLTLITCYPTWFIGPAPERLVVFSKLVDQADVTHAAEASAATASSPSGATH
jgi:sortase A